MNTKNMALPDDIRAAGWSVAVHNDYRLDGKPHTFWLFTKDGNCVKGEGEADLEALNIVRGEIAEFERARQVAKEIKSLEEYRYGLMTQIISLSIASNDAPSDALLWQIGRLKDQMPPRYAARMQERLDWHANGRAPALHRVLAPSTGTGSGKVESRWSIEEINQAMLDANIASNIEREKVVLSLRNPVPTDLGTGDAESKWLIEEINQAMHDSDIATDAEIGAVLWNLKNSVDVSA